MDSGPGLHIGLMSGTSVDAADAALVEFPADGPPRLLATHAEPPPAALREDLLHLSQQVAGVSLAKFGELDQRVGAWFADAAQAVMRKADVSAGAVAAIGSHGQTIRHEPEAPLPFSLQLGAASLIAARTGCRVVADFRNSDMAIGGQGAPLVPAFHRSVFADSQQARIVVNIGGIANLTILPTAAIHDLDAVTGLDTGPGNALMDAWVAIHLGRRLDDDGRWAASGRVDAPLLAQLMNDPYLRRPAPKSTGREHFNLDWLRAQIDSLHAPPDPVNVQATLCEFTACSIAQAVAHHGPGDERVLLCGGGVRNAELKRRLVDRLAPRDLVSTADYGLDPDWVEAVAFAWLAKRTVNGQSGNLPSVTGARFPVPLGAVHEARVRA
ncbi:anhydro-N-acetylmuramic acid kinase [Salinisphaera orenii MK-B5]|uniref:Anhydro-N-acetylmuramic acid kinase n=1 Tax=Salinisphaera orenii MK-B5 TaxID=856730 RepID=A0A423PFG6_9GAMM|nr:anhydro-N-acetylmuramic acid kinase [Salinisphaera orenii]ROO24246.1 anhydro-N-acetylmuramic acid kinase [Salinisphaera orenii MK-B5]